MAEWLKGNGFSYAWFLQFLIIAGAGFYAFGSLDAEVANLKDSTDSFARMDVMEPMFKNVDNKFSSLNRSLDDKFKNVDTKVTYINNNIQKVEVRMAGIDQNLSKILLLLAEK